MKLKFSGILSYISIREWSKRRIVLKMIDLEFKYNSNLFDEIQFIQFWIINNVVVLISILKNELKEEKC